MTLDIAANRRARKYTHVELAMRVLWGICEPLCRYSPRLLYSWRNAIFRLFGATIGADVRIYPSARIFFPWNLSVGNESVIGDDVLVYNLGHITLGQRVTISHGAQLCAGTHDHHRRDFPLLKPPIVIADDAWICTEAYVGPGVTVGAAAIVGARAVITHNVEPAAIMAGNPAKRVGTRNLEGAASGAAVDHGP